jgi:glycosyltransferase involved in cell wall biosynthesis
MSELRVLYSFPHRLGGDRICAVAKYQVQALADSGAKVIACPSSIQEPRPTRVDVRPTLALGRLRLPFRAIGRMHAFALHDHTVSRRLEKLAGEIDIVHTWPLAAERTLKVAARLQIPTVYERTNVHTRTFYETTRAECARLGVVLPAAHEHACNEEVLRKEGAEYELADRLFCQSEFAIQSFLDRGFPRSKLICHPLGFDPEIFFPDRAPVKAHQDRFTALFVGTGSPVKGLHYALEAWFRSRACNGGGTFLIAGTMSPSYRAKLAPLLSKPGVKLLGFRRDVPELMRMSDILMLPSISEGFALVTVEARASGCVPLVSEACCQACKHAENALVHRVGDVDALSDHITMLFENRGLLKRLRDNSLQTANQFTWKAAGTRLIEAYQDTISTYASNASSRSSNPTSRDI